MFDFRHESSLQKKVHLTTESATEKGGTATKFWFRRRKRAVGFSLVAGYLAMEF